MMYTTQLVAVGDAVMLTIPRAILDQLNLDDGARVSIEIDVEHGRLIVEPRPKPRYTLAELIANTDPEALAAAKADIWMTGGPVGRELL